MHVESEEKYDSVEVPKRKTSFADVVGMAIKTRKQSVSYLSMLNNQSKLINQSHQSSHQQGSTGPSHVSVAVEKASGKWRSFKRQAREMTEPQKPKEVSIEMNEITNRVPEVEEENTLVEEERTTSEVSETNNGREVEDQGPLVEVEGTTNKVAETNQTELADAILEDDGDDAFVVIEGPLCFSEDALKDIRSSSECPESSGPEKAGSSESGDAQAGATPAEVQQPKSPVVDIEMYSDRTNFWTYALSELVEIFITSLCEFLFFTVSSIWSHLGVCWWLGLAIASLG